MPRAALQTDPYAHDPASWGHSLANLADVVVPCLEAADARSVIEVGAFAGDLTRVLADWAADADAQVWAVDPWPHDTLVELGRERPEVELVRETSLAAIPQLPPADAVIVDGDHNYYMVSQELRLVEERAPDGELPLLLVHDVGWPLGRRDAYFALDLVPEEHRQPIAEGGGLFPGLEGVRPGGLPYKAVALREGGPRNGVRTAVEDFVAERDGLRLAIVPIFFGLGVVWSAGAPWADAVWEVLEPWDRNPLLEHLEANRVLQLAKAHLHGTQVARARDRVARQEAVLRRLLESSAFSVAERLSWLRHRLGIAPDTSVVSRDEMRRALEGG